MRTNARDLGARLQAIIGDVQARASVLHKAVAVDVFNAIVGSTPVDTGRLRNGWDVAIGQDSTYVPPETGGDDALARGLPRIAQAPAASKVTISNNVEYAAIIETGGFQPASPGPSKDPRAGRTGAIFVQGGYLTRAPQGLLVFGLLAAERRIREIEAAGGAQ